jgi:TRAP-type C4-dicarboxylate transport system permease small subunit
LKILVCFERWLESLEGFFLVASLVALLSLTLYAVVYRNLVGPIVLKMQTSALDEAAKAAAEAAAERGPAPEASNAAAPGAAAQGAGAAGGAYMGDLGDEAAPAAAAGSNAYMGDLADDSAPAAPAPAPAPAAANAYMGDLADDEAPAAPALAPAPAPAPAAANAYMGDLADDSAPSGEGAGGSYLGDLEGEEMAAPVQSAAPVVPAVVPIAIGAVEEPPMLRTLKALNFGWIDVVTRHLLLWVAFFGAAVAAGKRRHIKIDALSRLLPVRWRDRLVILLDLLSLVVCVFLARAAWHFMESEGEGTGMLYGPIPSWVGIVIIPVGFGLLAWHFAFEAVTGFAYVLGYRSKEMDARRSEQQMGGEA